MSRTRVGGMAVSLLLLSGMCAPSWAEHPAKSLMRLSNVGSQAQELASGARGEDGGSLQTGTPLPSWLDELLASVPQSGPTQPNAGNPQDQIQPTERVATPAKGPVQEPVTPVQEPVTPVQEPAGPVQEPIAEDGEFPRPRPIAPLYTSPALEGEGVWSPEGMPEDAQEKPLLYRTVYRPSAEFPNSVVHMVVFDMKRIKVRFFVGQTEPGVYHISEPSIREDNSKIVAVTNAMWMQRHAKGAGAIFRGQEVYPMVNGMATLVVYRDDSIDILEWTDDIPRHLIKDARQLRHLIVKNGRVVEEVAKGNKVQDAEIGLGGFLVDNNGVSTMRNKFWFLANRTAFGIREDGNLVFAMAHHCGTKDLAKALVLAGCKRAIHADANIHNIVCNFYFRGDKGKIVKRDKLSPDQLNYTMKRYDNGYTKDFFAFYER
ncbi:MAG: phosphodiester glycosidase family protein [Thermodesulfobacteriota bacterium]